jgi:hypothetical protein
MPRWPFVLVLIYGVAATLWLREHPGGAQAQAIMPVSAGNLVSGVTASAMTGTASTQVVAAVANKRLFVTRVNCNNASSSVDTLVTIQDGSGGTTLDILAAAHGYSSPGETNTYPLFVTSAGNGLYAADATTGASVNCSASGFAG